MEGARLSGGCGSLQANWFRRAQPTTEGLARSTWLEQGLRRSDQNLQVSELRTVSAEGKFDIANPSRQFRVATVCPRAAAKVLA